VCTNNPVLGADILVGRPERRVKALMEVARSKGMDVKGVMAPDGITFYIMLTASEPHLMHGAGGCLISLPVVGSSMYSVVRR
jgi:hypothetical protein